MDFVIACRNTNARNLYRGKEATLLILLAIEEFVLADQSTETEKSRKKLVA
jgi:hypothetical protein